MIGIYEHYSRRNLYLYLFFFLSSPDLKSSLLSGSEECEKQSFECILEELNAGAHSDSMQIRV